MAPASASQATAMLEMRFGESVTDALARLYQSPVAAVQEIVANAVAACKAARELYGADAYIRIHACGRNLSIEDRGSMGMEWAVFRDVYARAGSSLKRGANGAATPGMFGCGSLSYVLVSDIMFLASHSRETGDRYEVMACDGRGFQTGLPDPGMDWYGTRVRLTIRKGVGLDDVFDRIAEIADACGVRIVVDMDGADPECDDGSVWPFRVADRSAAVEAADAAKAEAEREEAPPGAADSRMADGVSGRYVFPASTFADEVRRANRLGGRDGTGGTDVVCIRAESEDLEVAALNQCNHDPDDVDIYGLNPANRTWLAGMPIEDPYDVSRHDLYNRRRGDRPYRTFRFPRGSNWTVMIHAKNERKYMPTPDRERFTDEAFGRLVDDAERLLVERLGAIRPATLAEYLSDPSNRALEPYATGRTEPRRDGRKRTARVKLNDARRTADGSIDERRLTMARAAGPVSLAIKDAGTTLWRLLYGGRSEGGAAGVGGRARNGRIEEPLLVVSERPNAELRRAIIDHAAANGRRRVVVFSPHPRNTMSANDYVGLGCESAAEYAERNGLCKRPAAKKPRRRKAAPAGTAVRRRRGSRPRKHPAKQEYVVHSGGRGMSGRRDMPVPVIETERIDSYSPPTGRTVVRCNDSESLAAMQGALVALECHTVCATREQSDVCGVVEFDDYADAAGASSYDTTIGRKSGRGLAECGRRVVLVVYDRRPRRTAELASLVAGSVRSGDGGGGGKDDGAGECGDAVYVFGPPDELAGCAAYLGRSGASLGVWMLPSYNVGGDESVIAGKSYLASVAEPRHSPAGAAARWVRSAIGGIMPEYGRDARNIAMELLHAHLEGEELLRGAGIEYDGNYDSSGGGDGAEDGGDEDDSGRDGRDDYEDEDEDEDEMSHYPASLDWSADGRDDDETEAEA